MKPLATGTAHGLYREFREPFHSKGVHKEIKPMKPTKEEVWFVTEVQGIRVSGKGFGFR